MQETRLNTPGGMEHFIRIYIFINILIFLIMKGSDQSMFTEQFKVRIGHITKVSYLQGQFMTFISKKSLQEGRLIWKAPLSN